MDFKTHLIRVFAWWLHQTFGTQLWTWRFGELVGEDEFGNRYYREKGGKISPALGYNRRWVIYNGESEASRVAPEWHGWLHHTWQEPPTARPIARRPWEKPHQANLTGTAAAYRPPGSILGPSRPPTADYEAWSPE